MAVGPTVGMAVGLQATMSKSHCEEFVIALSNLISSFVKLSVHSSNKISMAKGGSKDTAITSAAQV